MRSIFLSVSAIVCSSAFFYALYYCVLRSSRQHQLNRCCLLATFLFSALLPFIHFPLPPRFSFVVNIEPNSALLQESIIDVAPPIQPISLASALHLVYWIGAAVFAVLLLCKIVRLVASLKTKSHSTFGRLTIVENPRQTTPYSFFRFLIINLSMYSPEELRTICLHEEAHAKQLHSVDILLLEIVRVFIWFNPMFVLYKRELRNIHEYLADDAVVLGGTDPEQYLQLMLKQVKTQNHLFLGHPFSAELLKSRIKMIKYKKDSSNEKWKYALLVPLMVAIVLLYSACFPPETMAQSIHNNSETVPVKVSVPQVIDNKPVVSVQKYIRKTKPTSVQSAAETSSQNILSEQTWMNQLGTTVDIVNEHDRDQTRTAETFNVIVVSVDEDSFTITTSNE